MTVSIRLYSASSTWAKPDNLAPNEIWVRGKAVHRNGVTVQLAAMERRVFLILATRQHGHTSMAELIEALWGGDIDGGPDYAVGVVKIAITTLRDAGAALGFRIDARRGYTLVPIVYQERADAA